MASTQYGVNSPETVKLWSERLFRESLKTTYMGKFMGSGSDSMIQLLDNTQKSAGDRITVTLRMLLDGEGVTGDNTLEGNEEAITTYTDNLLIDQLRHAVRSSGKMSEQRVLMDHRKEAYMGLKDWWKDRFDTALFNQLAGNTGQTNLAYTGHNATVAPTSTRFVYPTGDSSESDVNSGTAEITLEQIDYAVEKAKTADIPIRPLMVNGEEKYILFLHPYAVTDLRTNTSTGQWLDIQKASMQGGQVSKNPIFTGALGEYNGVVIHQSTRVPAAPSLPNVRRNIFCGAQAGVIAFGQGYNGSAKGQRWVEKEFDYDNQLGVSSAFIWGAKKTVFNSTDFGTLVLPTYSIAHG